MPFIRGDCQLDQIEPKGFNTDWLHSLLKAACLPGQVAKVTDKWGRE